MNLLIVDDQPNVLASLLCVINWQEAGISDVYTASSALAAKELLKEKQIHILITDIEMPVENGLSLIRWVREQSMPVECILLTSHADFSYAKQGIALGVFEYILQPARKEDILRAVENARIRVEKNRQIESLTKSSKTASKLQNAFIRQMFESWPDRPAADDPDNLLGQQLRHLQDLGIHHDRKHPVTLIAVSFTKWFTLPPAPLEMLPLYQKYASEVFAFAQGEMLSYVTKACYFVTAVFSAPLENTEETLRTLQEVFRQQLNAQAIIYYCTARFNEVGSAVAALYDYLDDGGLDLEKERSGTILPVSFRGKSDSASKVPANIENYFSEIEEFIDRNIASPITRAQIAKCLHLSPDYISHIVRVSAGCSCKELIIRKKMALARRLLRTTSLPIGEVAEKCGYDNFAYFSRVYKSYYNVVPSSERS